MVPSASTEVAASKATASPVALEVNAAVGGGVGRRCLDGHLLAGLPGRPAVVGDGERHRVGAGRRVGVRRGGAGAGAAVAEVPGVAGDGAVRRRWRPTRRRWPPGRWAPR